MEARISYEEAICRVLEVTGPVGKERIPLADCFSRILGETVTASELVPPFDRSPYDGYALRSEDVKPASPAHPVTLRILEEIPAGSISHGPVTAGTAVKILTGAPIPEGADAVVMFEKTEFTDRQVTLFHPLNPGKNIVCAGEDVRRGEVLAGEGQKIDAGLMGALAAQNRTEVTVFRKPVIGLISTGNELIPVGRPLGPGQVHDFNRYSLTGALLGLGCVPVFYGIAGDRVSDIAGAIRKALAECDGVLLTGGVSVGDYDRTPEAMEAAGVRLLFRGCAIKPGMACAYGTAEGKLVGALSGNPSSAMVNFQVIARPALQKLSGRQEYRPRELVVTLEGSFEKKSPVTRFLWGHLDLTRGEARIRILGKQGNVALGGMIGCDVLAEVPAGSGRLENGTRLKGIWLGG